MAGLIAVWVNFLLFLVKFSNAEEANHEDNGGWRPATLEDSMKYYTNICSIPKISIKEMTAERFMKEFQSKPFILTFANGAADWVQTDYWTVRNLSLEYEDWEFSAGKSIDIVYNGGKGDFNRTFSQYVKEMREKAVPGGDITYLFDRFFYYNSSLPSTVSVPDFLFKEGDPILFVGPSGTGATWHKHMPAWNGVVFGQKRWFVYPLDRAPPGGLYSYTPMAWFENVYPKLKPSDKPMECIQNAGEIFYVPESFYHAILNIGETVAISIQSKEVTTDTESEFYNAMADHYKASTTEDRAKASQLFERAIKKYVDLHFLYPENTDVLAHISEIACDRGHATMCERVLDLLIKLDPYAIESIKLRSRIYYDRREYELCEQELLRAIDIHPSSKSLLREYANLLWNIRKFESKQAFEKVLSVLDPETEEAQSINEILRITDFGIVPESSVTPADVELAAEEEEEPLDMEIVGPADPVAVAEDTKDEL